MKLYHGSQYDDLEELEGNDPGYRGSLGYGLYLTSDEDFASHFGKNIYEVESPVPEDLVATIEPDTYHCGGSLVLYTPGSAPFTFTIEDRATGECHRYSVLEDCEEEVKAALGVQALDGWKLTPDLLEQARELPPETRPLVEECFHEVMSALHEEARWPAEACEEQLGRAQDEGLDESVIKQIESLMESIVESAEVFRGAEVKRILGEEVGLDELSTICERHGYSAFHIDGYSPGGDEYVIFDKKYLPIPVKLAS